MNPKVSICIPTYNGAAFLTEALESAINQTYSNLEIVISDDASTDETLAIAKQFQQKTVIPIRIYNHSPNGIGANWNHCIKQAKGEYIKFLFQDDILMPTCIEEMVNVAVKNGNEKVGLVYSRRSFLFDVKNNYQIEWIKSYGRLDESWKEIKIINEKPYLGTELLKQFSLLDFPMNKIGEPTAVLLKKEVFYKVGFFSTVLQQSLDIEFWYRLMRYYSIVFLESELVSFRLHDNQASFVNFNKRLSEEDVFSKSLYDHIFWQLHWRSMKRLFYKHNLIGRYFYRIVIKWYDLKKKL